MGLHVVAVVADHHDRVLRIERGTRGKHMAEERSPGEPVQNLRASRLHSGALAGGKHHDREWPMGNRRGRSRPSAVGRIGHAASSPGTRSGW